MPALVSDLMRPQAYPAPRPTRVTLETTHASWVFLTDEEVWKIKRPVSLGFLDYSTPEARRRCCEDEVRLNRRLAPGVYLGVAPIYRGPGGYSLRGPGEVADWAVRMRRLPAEASARAWLVRGALDGAALGRLAARLAAFFGAAAPAPSYGEPAVLAANVRENFAQVQPFVGDDPGALLGQQTFDQVQAFQLRCLAQDARRFAARVAAGRVRDGHGDLRLDHVYFVDRAEPPLVIDCIEFNDRFRCGDVAGEVAFLAMELEGARRPDLAASFVARFAEASDDFDLYGVLDFYLSYRAWVRGKVAGFVAADPLTPPDVRAAKQDEARRAFGLARAFAGAAPLDPLFVVAVGGMIAAGKTTVAAALGEALAVPVISSDRTRKALGGLGPLQVGNADLYSDAFTRRTYDELFRRAGVVLATGRGVVVDATFATRRHRHELGELARTAGAEFLLVEARCDEATAQARLRARRPGAQVSDATAAVRAQLAARYEPPTELGELGRAHHVIAETGAGAAADLAPVLRALAELGILPAAQRRVS